MDGSMRAAAQVLRTNFTDVVESGLRTFGRAVELAATVVGGSVTDTVRGRFRWKDALQQAWFLVTVTAVPAVLIAIPFGIIVSIQVGNLIEQLGADALLGAAGGMGVIKQGAPMATGFLLGGGRRGRDRRRSRCTNDSRGDRRSTNTRHRPSASPGGTPPFRCHGRRSPRCSTS